MQTEKIKNISLILISLSLCLFSYSFYLKQGHEYELVQLGEMRRDQFLLDKKTGRNWVSVCLGKATGPDCDGNVIWEEKIVVGINGYSFDDYQNYLKYMHEKETAEKTKSTKK